MPKRDTAAAIGPNVHEQAMAELDQQRESKQDQLASEQKFGVAEPSLLDRATETFEGADRIGENGSAKAAREGGGVGRDFDGKDQAAAASSTDNRVIHEGTGSSRRRESGVGAEAISAIEADLGRWREHDRGVLLTQEVGASREVYEQHLRGSLRFARETLDAAYNALTQETGRSKSALNPAQVRETIRALGTEESWNQLLQSHDIVITGAIRDAVSDLVARIGRMDADNVSAESEPAKALLKDIEFLRGEISQALRTSRGMLPRGYAQLLITTSREVATEVMVGLTAASTTAELAGTPLVPEVVYTALGLAVASSLKELYRRSVARLLRIHSSRRRLREYHRLLISAIDDLCRCIPWLATSKPPLPDALATVSTVRLDAVFLLGCVDQLAIAIVWPGRDRYRRILDSIRELLDEVGRLIAGEVTRDIEEIGHDLAHCKDLLEGCSESINRHM
jgi:hypothetical protein